MKSYLFLLQFIIINSFTQIVIAQTSKQSSKKDTISQELQFETFTLGDKKSDYIRIFDNKKIVILDFWATFCLPCLENLKHLDSIASKYKNELDIIAVSRENIEKIKKNLNYIPQLKSSNILFSSDTFHTSYISYSVVPTTFIIKNGIVKYTSIGQQTTLKLFDSLYQYTHEFDVPIVEKKQTQHLPQLENEMVQYDKYNIQFGKSQNGNVSNFTFDSSRKGHYTFSLENFSPLLLYRYSYDFISVNWILNQLKDVDISFKPENIYSLKIEGNFLNKNELLKVAKNVLAQNFPNIKATLTNKLDSVFVLKIDTSNLKFKKIISLDTTAAKFISYQGPNFQGKNITIAELLYYLSNEIGYLYNNVVLDETPFYQRINLNLEWSYANPSTLATELSKYGISLAKELRNVQFLVLH